MATKKTPTKKTTQSAAEPKAPARAAAKGVKPSKTVSQQETLAAPEKGKPTKMKASSRAPAEKAAQVARESAAEGILARAEEDVTKLLESLNTQMTAAMHAFEELAAMHRGRGGVVTRTRPLDRATAMFQRLVTEVMDERFGEFLPLLVALRTEMDQRAKAAANAGESADAHSGDAEFHSRGTQMLDQVLVHAEVQPFLPKVGDAFDPLIHLAVGETQREDIVGDVVSEVLQTGYRTARGRVIQVARVKVNRR